MTKKSSSGTACCIAFILLFWSSTAFATHIGGGGFSYRFLGDTSIYGTPHKIYDVTLQFYQDCDSGVKDAMIQDKQISFTVFKGTGSDTCDPKVIPFFITSTPSNALHILSNCGWITSLATPNSCLSTLVFTRRYYLPVSPDGYKIATQRCCRNGNITNILDPLDRGITFFCTIPGDTTSANNSAIFPGYFPQAFCVNKTVSFSYAATDPDGDSLSYELSPLFTYDNERMNILPKVASPPPFPTVSSAPGYSATEPFGVPSSFTIDPRSGRITITPTTQGNYAVGIVCKEWRNGLLINETRRELEWVVFSCSNDFPVYKPFAGKDLRIVRGTTVNLVGSGAKTYSWSPATFLNDANSSSPIATFTEPGTFTYILHGVSDSGCSGYDTIIIDVANNSELTFPNVFTPNNDGVNDLFQPIPIGNTYVNNFRVFNKWGNLMYDVRPANGRASWDGKWNGELQPPGVYVYQLDYTDNLGATHNVTGTITLLK